MDDADDAPEYAGPEDDGYVEEAVDGGEERPAKEEQSEKEDFLEEDVDLEVKDERGVSEEIRERVAELNEQIFSGGIDDSALDALAGIDGNRALDILKLLEDKGASVANPTGYIKASVRRESDKGNSKGRPDAGKGREHRSKGHGKPQGFIDQTVRQRCISLNANKFGPGAITDEAMSMLSAINFDRAMDILSGLEAKGPDGVKNANGYVQAAAKRELQGDGKGKGWDSGKGRDSGKGKGGGERDASVAEKVAKRCRWLNHNVFTNDPIDDGAVDALMKLAEQDYGRAMAITKDAEEQGSLVRDVSQFLRVAVRDELEHQIACAGQQLGQHMAHGMNPGIIKRCEWLNRNLFLDSPITEVAMQEISTLDFGIALDILKNLELKGDKIRNPSAYLNKAVKNDVQVRIEEAQVLLEQEARRHDSRDYRGDKGKGDKGAKSDGKGTVGIDSRVHKRITWLNANLFGNMIEESTVEVLSQLPFGRVMEITKDMEEKGPDRVGNPNGYLQAAAKRELRGEPPKGKGDKGGKSDGKGKGDVDSRVHKRITWLNANMFGNMIEESTVELLSQLDFGRVMEITKDLEEKGPDRVRNPNGYLQAAVTRELRGEPSKGKGKDGQDGKASHRFDPYADRGKGWDDGPGKGKREPTVFHGDRGPPDRGSKGKHDDGKGRFDDRGKGKYDDRGKGHDGKGKEKGKDKGKPVGPIDAAIRKRCDWLNRKLFPEGPGIDEEAMALLSALDYGRALEICNSMEERSDSIANPAGYLKTACKRELQEAAANLPIDPGVQKRCMLLNKNVFGQGAIDEAAMGALSSVDFARAMEMCNDLEEKGRETVANPSAYIKTAVRREHMGQDGPPTKKGKGNFKGKY